MDRLSSILFLSLARFQGLFLQVVRIVDGATLRSQSFEAEFNGLTNEVSNTAGVPSIDTGETPIMVAAASGKTPVTNAAFLSTGRGVAISAAMPLATDEAVEFLNDVLMGDGTSYNMADEITMTDGGLHVANENPITTEMLTDEVPTNEVLDSSEEALASASELVPAIEVPAYISIEGFPSLQIPATLGDDRNGNPSVCDTAAVKDAEMPNAVSEGNAASIEIEVPAPTESFLSRSKSYLSSFLTWGSTSSASNEPGGSPPTAAGASPVAQSVAVKSSTATIVSLPAEEVNVAPAATIVSTGPIVPLSKDVVLTTVAQNGVFYNAPDVEMSTSLEPRNNGLLNIIDNGLSSSEEEDFITELESRLDIISKIQQHQSKEILKLLKPALRKLIDFLKRGAKKKTFDEVSKKDNIEEKIDPRFASVARGFLLQLMQLELQDEVPLSQEVVEDHDIMKASIRELCDNIETSMSPKMKELHEELQLLTEVEREYQNLISKIGFGDNQEGDNHGFQEGEYFCMLSEDGKTVAKTDGNPENNEKEMPVKVAEMTAKSTMFSDIYSEHKYVSFAVGTGLAFLIDNALAAPTHVVHSGTSLTAKLTRHVSEFATEMGGEYIVMPILRHTPGLRSMSNEAHLATKNGITSCGHSIIAHTYEGTIRAVEGSRHATRGCQQAMIHVAVPCATMALTAVLAKLADTITDLINYSRGYKVVDVQRLTLQDVEQLAFKDDAGPSMAPLPDAKRQLIDVGPGQESFQRIAAIPDDPPTKTWKKQIDVTGQLVDEADRTTFIDRFFSWGSTASGSASTSALPEVPPSVVPKM